MNIKIKGTTSKLYNGILFDSILECNCFKKLQLAGLNPSYESETITLWEGLASKDINIDIYYPNKEKGTLRYKKEITKQCTAFRKMTYTPDFVVIKREYKIYFDAKGYPNDMYPLKRKMFLKLLNDRNDEYKYMFFEPHSIYQVLQAIKIIQEL